MRKMLAVAGLHCAGKDVAARYLVERHGYEHVIDVSEILREGANRIRLGQDLWSLLRTYKELGSGYFFDKITKRVNGDGSATIVSSVRALELYNMLQSRYSADLLYVDAQHAVRVARMPARGRKLDIIDPEEFADFERQEIEFYQFEKLLERAIRVENNRTVEELHAQLDHVVQFI